jgi:hypothetical protein
VYHGFAQWQKFRLIKFSFIIERKGPKRQK